MSSNVQTLTYAFLGAFELTTWFLFGGIWSSQFLFVDGLRALSFFSRRDYDFVDAVCCQRGLLDIVGCRGMFTTLIIYCFI